MTTEILVALIGGTATVSAVVVGRILSHFEHKKTESTINRIEIQLNGKLEERIKIAVQAALKEKQSATGKLL